MGGTSISSSAGFKARIRRALRELKGKDGTLSELTVDGQGRLHVRDAELPSLIAALQDRGDIEELLQGLGQGVSLKDIQSMIGLRSTPVDLKQISIIKALEANGSAYSAGDILCETDTNGEGTPWIFNVVDKKGGAGTIISVLAETEVEAITPRLALQVYTKSPSIELDDNAAAASPIATDLDSLIFKGEIALSAMIARGDNSYSMATLGTAGGLPIPFICDRKDTKLYIVVITQDAITFTATQRLRLELIIERY